ncbi:hypothetical protein SISSUDRAFT_1051358 [Sistotremastrum suecicum HHB10207 ss-3]|uniref:Uncharacterized protein n=1 Tax=Sistotremastrum suecicum HHB10207 ss-3 TaxID=1314776 RepID=A0A166AMH2_9AGAM|nr:hypothetical protein SISSUDRAFT_1051358 [Sistotremastrum suecicum HHB10207 ss-3]
MANPSSSHRERDRERHHHHRSISSTTLLLVLSLILAVLAVMLSLPSSRGASQSVAEPAADPSSTGIWTYLTPKRSQALVAREHAVAVREAEVAKREAELLAGSIGGVSQPVSTSSASVCAPCPTIYASPPVSAPPPIETIIKEVVREIETIGTAPPPPWWKDQVVRVEDLLQREERIGEREKDVGHREETVGKRESDAARRENWIMEQLISLGNDPAPYTVETEEFVYEPGSRNRKVPPPPRRSGPV